MRCGCEFDDDAKRYHPDIECAYHARIREQRDELIRHCETLLTNRIDGVNSIKVYWATEGIKDVIKKARGE